MITTISVKAADNNSTIFSGYPSYTIITYSNEPAINRGDNISISVYISGAGSVDFNRFRVSIPPYLVKNNNVEITDFNYSNKGPIPPHNSYFFQSQFETYLDKKYFETPDPIYNAGYQLTNIGDLQIEEEGIKYAPFTFNFMIDDHAPSGNHEISLILIYKNGTQWHLIEKFITIHVNYFYEQSWFHYTLLIVSVLSLSFWTGIVNKIIDNLKKYRFLITLV